MEKRPPAIGNPVPAPVPPAGDRARPTPRAPMPATGGHQNGRQDLEAAAARLDRLLHQDAAQDGRPRTDVKTRGFYLDIRV